MSKVSKNIKMLDILSSGKKYTCTQLSELLEVSPRMVRSYKDELEKEGIYIDTMFGKEGGYQLRSKVELPSILFNKNDIVVIDSLAKKVTDQQTLKQLDKIKQKIINYCKLVDHETSFLDESKRNILEEIQKCITENQSIKIEYDSKDIVKQRVVYPKQVYIYENVIMIIVQYSDDLNDIRHLNINRIKKIIK